MLVKKYISILIFLNSFLLFKYSYSQSSLNNVNSASSYIPATPNVTAFQKYGDIPVDYSSGTPNITIPIGSLKLKEFEWPISLSYHSSGNKLSEVASNVGLGWVLNATSIVSAKVIGENDLIFPNVANSLKRNLVFGGYTGYGALVCILINQIMNMVKFLHSRTITHCLICFM